MIVGTVLISNGSGNTYYSPSFPRGNDAAHFSIDVLDLNGTATLNVEVQHRNSEDSSFSAVGVFSGITATGLHELSVSGLKEIIRFKYYFSADTAGDWFYILVAAPQWWPLS